MPPLAPVPRPFFPPPPVRPDALSRLAPIAPSWILTSERRDLRLSQLLALAGFLERPEAAPEREALSPVLAGGLLWAFQEDPFDARLPPPLLGLEARRPFLPGALRTLLRVLAQRLAPAEDVSLWDSILATGDEALARQFMAVAARDQIHAPFWLGRVWPVLRALPDADEAERLFRAFTLPGLEPLRRRMEAELAFARRRDTAPNRVEALAAGLDPDLWGLFACHLRARLLAETGRDRLADQAWGALWRAMPWHVNLTLVLAERKNPMPVSPAAGDDVAVLVYSLNKADLLGECLAHLATTDLGQALVVVLDNGSDDATPEVTARSAGLFRPGRFRSLRLRANVGAPGARNWLLSLPEVREKKYAAFLDDDAFPPKDWLRRLVGLAETDPRAATIGCAVVDREPPRRLQSADFNLLPPGRPAPSPWDPPERIALCDPCSGDLDLGFHDYVRPCLSVSGCCHLLRLEAVAEVGAFDARFSPSQFDDLERDLRCAKMGWSRLYHGGVKTGHVQFSSMRQPESADKISRILGARHVLEGLYSDADLAALYRDNQAALWRDVLSKAAFLNAVLPERS